MGLTQDEPGPEQNEGERKSQPTERPISFRIWRYFLLCGAVALFTGLISLVATFAEEQSRHIIWSFSYALAFSAVLAFLLGAVAIALSRYLQRRNSGRVAQTVALVCSDLIVGLSALWLLLSSLGFGNVLIQLSLVQFLLGEEEIQYRHLMMLSAYAGSIFGVAAGWKSKTAYGIDWATSIWHGARVFLETAFLAYAGLWLSKGPFEYGSTQAKEANWGIATITLLGIALIFAGSLSLMYRQSQIRPEVTKTVEQIPFRAKVRQQIQELRHAISVAKTGIKWLIDTLRK